MYAIPTVTKQNSASISQRLAGATTRYIRLGRQQVRPTKVFLSSQNWIALRFLNDAHRLRSQSVGATQRPVTTAIRSGPPASPPIKRYAPSPVRTSVEAPRYIARGTRAHIRPPTSTG